MSDEMTSLTKNQEMVLGALNDAKSPMSAYAILDELRDEGFRAPPQVYRALEKLVAGLRQLNADLSVPSPASWGIDEKTWFDSLPVMAEQALASGSPANNPRIPEAADIIALYERVWAA